MDRYPQNNDYRRQLGLICNNLGLLLLKDSDRMQEAEASLRQALEIREELVEADAEVADWQSDLGGSLHNVALVLQRQRRWQAARNLLDEAILHQLIARQKDPAHARYRLFLLYHYDVLAPTLLRLGEYRKAAAAANQLREVPPESSEYCVRAARYLAGCAALADHDAPLPVDQRAKLADAYGEQAVKSLQKAVELGFHDADALNRTADFDPLRERGDFKALLKHIATPK